MDADRDSSARQPDLGDVLDQLEELEETMTSPEQHEQLQETRKLVETLGEAGAVRERISKFTGRDLGEAFIGSILFGLPMLVEDVLPIANHFLQPVVLGLPLFLFAHVGFVMTLILGVIYGIDIREVSVTNPLFGVVPRRFAGVFAVSFLTSAGLMYLWGQLFVGEPEPLSVIARVTIVWAPAALGASLGDILPGESKGTDLTTENVVEMVDFDDESP